VQGNDTLPHQRHATRAAALLGLAYHSLMDQQGSIGSFTIGADVLLITLAIIAGVALLVALIVWRKGRPFAAGHCFRASRLSAGNHLFPTQVLITPQSVVQYTPRWIGRHEESIHMAHVASVRIDTGMLLSNVLIETTGGSSPIHCRGHRKKDAVRMKQLIEEYQSGFYQNAPPAVRSEG
jgi:hypothetical protein